MATSQSPPTFADSENEGVIRNFLLSLENGSWCTPILPAREIVKHSIPSIPQERRLCIPWIAEGGPGLGVVSCGFLQLLANVPAADRSGVKATYVSEMQETRINFRILLAALRRFYDHLISSKIYEPPNPLLHAEMGRVTQELRTQ